MSGAVKSNVFGSSGTVAAAAGGLSWQDVVTASLFEDQEIYL